MDWLWWRNFQIQTIIVLLLLSVIMLVFGLSLMSGGPHWNWTYRNSYSKYAVGPLYVISITIGSILLGFVCFYGCWRSFAKRFECCC